MSSCVGTVWPHRGVLLLSVCCFNAVTSRPQSKYGYYSSRDNRCLLPRSQDMSLNFKSAYKKSSVIKLQPMDQVMLFNQHIHSNLLYRMPPHRMEGRKEMLYLTTQRIVHIKEPLLLIGKRNPYVGSRIPLSLSERSFTICPTPYKCK